MCDTQRSRRCVPHAATRDTSLTDVQGECALLQTEPFGGYFRRIHRRTLQRQRSSACRNNQTNAAFLLCVERQLRCASTHTGRACYILQPQPLPRGLVGNGINEPPKPLRRMNNNHTITRSGMQLRSPCFGSLQPWYQEQFKTPLQSRLSKGKVVSP